jgi:quercetin dioxygenase-like cupin family protein
MVRSFLARGRNRVFVLMGTVVIVAVAATGAYALLPSHVDVTFPDTSKTTCGPLGTASCNPSVVIGATPLDVASVSAFTTAINKDHSSNIVETANKFADNQNTGWHTHPGPNIAVIVSGTLKLEDEHCNWTTYPAGTAFATGTKVHYAVAVGETTFYNIYFLPGDATVLRTNADPPACAR